MNKAYEWNLGRLKVAFSHGDDGDMRDPALRRRWFQKIARHRRPAFVRQVHGVAVCDAAQIADETASGAPAQQGDALIALDNEHIPAVFGADCPGVVVDTGDAFGLAHCGWRSTAAGIITELCSRLRDHSANGPETWRALIGPGISGDMYEVDGPVLRAHNWCAEALTPLGAGKALLDVRIHQEFQLRAEGITHIHRSDICTAKDPQLGSHRHGGEKAPRQLLAAWVP